VQSRTRAVDDKKGWGGGKKEINAIKDKGKNAAVEAR
jgi:hypothetical protein